RRTLVAERIRVQTLPAGVEPLDANAPDALGFPRAVDADAVPRCERHLDASFTRVFTRPHERVVRDYGKVLVLPDRDCLEAGVGRRRREVLERIAIVAVDLHRVAHT